MVLLCNITGQWPFTLEGVLTGAFGCNLGTLALISVHGVIDRTPQDENAAVMAVLGIGK